MNGIWYLSLMTVGVGFIAGRGGVAFIIGGFVAYWFLSPMLAATGGFPFDDAGSLISDPGQLRILLYRPLGIGMLIGGAMMGVVLALPLIISTVRSMQKVSRIDAAVSPDEMPIKLLYVAIFGAAIVLCIIAITSVESLGLAEVLAWRCWGHYGSGCPESFFRRPLGGQTGRRCPA